MRLPKKGAGKKEKGIPLREGGRWEASARPPLGATNRSRLSFPNRHVLEAEPPRAHARAWAGPRPRPLLPRAGPAASANRPLSPLSSPAGLHGSSRRAAPPAEASGGRRRRRDHRQGPVAPPAAASSLFPPPFLMSLGSPVSLRGR